MSKLAIKIQLAERVYPMTIDSEEEVFIREAEKRVNEYLKIFRDKFHYRDKQDLLAMVVLQLSVETLKLNSEKENQDTHSYDLIEKIDLINNKINQYFQDI